MLGDDPDPSVATARVGSRGVSDAREGAASWQEGLGDHSQEGRENQIGLGTINECNGEKRGTATTSGCKFYENMQMQCT